ncbi:DIX domain protein [Aphelenchoides besseyi]|nr:DIX domain protein [Aphelenchoides besseyi]KAI6208177.1 DIX domain protein [Aphelenchoides besseyi]
MNPPDNGDLSAEIQSLQLNTSNGKTAPIAEADSHSDANSFEAVSQTSTEQKATSVGSSSTLGPNVTRVYYHIDDEVTPYMTEVAVAPDKITLGDFKQVLNRSNFKYYCMALDNTVGTDVKNEIRDDDHRLQKSSNGHFELFLLTAEGSSHSDPTSSAYTKPHRHGSGIPGPAPNTNYFTGHQFQRHKNHFPLHYESGLGPRRFLDDSTVYTESELRYSDDESRVSTSTDNVTSVSRQPHNYYRRKQQRRFRRQPSRASTVSSMTETSMSLQVIYVKLNMDTVNFLGISIVGHSSARGDNGIYIGHIMPGGAVALDGRIEVGDMLLEVNDTSFEKLTNDEAVAFLKEAVSKRGSIKLTVAKSFDSARNNFVLPMREPTRPIDTRAWVQHTNAMIGLPLNSIPERAEEAPTPIPGQFPPLTATTYVRPQSSSTATSNGSGGQNTVVSGGQIFFPFGNRFNLKTDRRIVAQAMALPNSGLEVRNRTWLKIPVPMSFLGSALIDWLIEHVEGIRDRKDARKYAGDLLRDRLISHVVNKSSFSEQTYYVFGDECAEVLKLRNEDGTARTDLQPDLRPSLPQQPPPQLANGHRPFNWSSSHSGEYASMPPFSTPNMFNSPLVGNPLGTHGLPIGLDGARHGDLHSQVSSNEGSNSSDQRKKPKIPPAPQLALNLGLYQPKSSIQQPPSMSGENDPLLQQLGSVQGIGTLKGNGFFVDHL